jgi:hypothetical protein
MDKIYMRIGAGSYRTRVHKLAIVAFVSLIWVSLAAAESRADQTVENATQCYDGLLTKLGLFPNRALKSVSKSLDGKIAFSESSKPDRLSVFYGGQAYDVTMPVPKEKKSALKAVADAFRDPKSPEQVYAVHGILPGNATLYLRVIRVEGRTPYVEQASDELTGDLTAGATLSSDHLEPQDANAEIDSSGKPLKELQQSISSLTSQFIANAFTNHGRFAAGFAGTDKHEIEQGGRSTLPVLKNFVEVLRTCEGAGGNAAKSASKAKGQILKSFSKYNKETVTEENVLASPGKGEEAN